MENESSSDNSEDDIINRVFFKKYHCIKKLGEGSFGRIYEGVYNSEHFALKFEDINSNSNLLESEASIMNYLKGPNIPFVKSYGFNNVSISTAMFTNSSVATPPYGGFL